MKDNVLIVGCGIVGSVIARYLAEEKGMSVTIWERRDHIGGNMYDFEDEYGIRVHQYGPHIFHTNNKDIYDYVCKYGEWEPFKLVCGAVMDGICTPTAFNFKTIDLFYSKEKAIEIKQHIKNKFGERDSATVVELLDCDDPIIRDYAQFLFDKDYSLYTAKQWGISPKEIDKSVLKRVPIRFSYEEAYFADEYQVMPKEGYTKFISNILSHPNIKVELNVEALEHLKIREGSTLCIDGQPAEYPVIYTGPLDELFGFEKGRLPYRSLRFEWKHEEVESFQEMPVVAYPQAKDYTRITEYKKLPVQDREGTTYAIEYPLPYSPDNTNMEPYYPVLTEDSQKMYKEYRNQLEGINNLYCCGRLADFKYYDMDKAIESAFAFLKNTEF